MAQDWKFSSSIAMEMEGEKKKGERLRKKLFSTTWGIRIW